MRINHVLKPRRYGMLVDTITPIDPDGPPHRPAAISPTSLVAILCLSLGVDQLLLWRFLGRLPLLAMLPAVVLVAVPALLLLRTGRPDIGWKPSGRAAATCTLVAMLVCWRYSHRWRLRG